MRRVSWFLGSALTAFVLGAPLVARAEQPASKEPASQDGGSKDAAGKDAAGKDKGDQGTDLTVVGTKEAETGGSVHSIKRKQLERFKHDDPHALLLSVPGVYVRGEDGYGLRPNIGIRGATSDRSKKVTLMEDGVLFGPAPYSAPAAYYFPLIQRMRGLRVVKGPSSIVFGPQTIGGAIDLLTEDIPATPSGMGDVAFGNFGYTKLHARQGLSGDRLGYLVEGINVTSTGFKQLDGGGDTGFSRREFLVKGGYTVYRAEGVTHDLGLKLGYGHETSNETYLGLTDADFRQNPYRRYVASRLDRMTWDRTSVTLTHTLKLGAAFEVITAAYRHDLHRSWNRLKGLRSANLDGVLADPEAPANAFYLGALRGTSDTSSPAESILIGPNDRTFVSQGVQTAARWTTKGEGWENRLEYGARLHNDEIHRLQSQDGYLMQGGKLVRDGRPTEITDDNRGSTTAFALYFADALVWKRFVVTPGVRLELIRSRFKNNLTGGDNVGSAQAVLPGMGAYYALTKQLGVLAGLHRGFSPPPPGSGSTRVEDSINYEGGVRYTGKKLRAEIVGFFNDYKNFANVCSEDCGNGVNQDRQYDAGAVWVYGAEAFVETEVKTDFGVTFPARATYTFTATEILDNFTTQDPLLGDPRQRGRVTAGSELPYIPQHQASAMFGAEGKRWGVAVSATHVSRMREVAGQGSLDSVRTTDAYTIFDVSGNVKPVKWAQLYVNVRNLTDQAYLVSHRPFGARPGAPRSIMAGLKVEF